MFTLEQLKGNLNTVDRQLLYNIQNLLIEQNELLRQLVDGNKRETVDIDSMRRQDLLKLAAERGNMPKGFSRWTTDKIRDYLKGVV